MTHKELKTKLKSSSWAALSALLLLVFNVFIPGSQVYGLQLGSRSVQVSSAIPSAITTHRFQFSYPSSSNVGSVVFEYCENNAVFAYSCDVPAGLDVTSAVLNSQTGTTGFTIDSADTTANKLVISRVSVPNPISPSTYTFGNIKNPSAAHHTEFVRISTHASTDGTGASTDEGGVAFSTVSAFSIGALVPPHLLFCVGVTVTTDCTTSSGDSVNLGDLTTAHASASQSQFSTATNSTHGYSVSVLGTTMTSGNNTIAALTTPTSSFPGNSQFGINLRANSNPAVGADPSGPGSVSSPTANYDISNRFMFEDGSVLATSAPATDFNRMTVSYLANISHQDPIGVYGATLTYVATAQF